MVHRCSDLGLSRLLLLAAVVLGACTSQPKQTTNQNFYDKYLFFDMDTEVEKVACPIQGEIPAWLSGTLLRNGPAKFQVGDKRVGWFDGLAMLHAFDFSPDQVLYTNRFIRSEQYYIMMDGKSLNFGGFAQDPCPQVFKNQTSKFIPQDAKNIKNAGVTIQEYADQMVALTETPLPVVFDVDTLNTLGNFQFQDQLPQGQWMSAHSQNDMAAGETVSYYVHFGQKSSYVIWTMADHSSTRQLLAEIPVDLPAYIHSFALTEHYAILVEFPFVVNPLDLMAHKQPFIYNYKWMPQNGTNFYVVDRSSGNVTKIKGDPFFSFHHVNAFDEKGKIYIDIVTYANADTIALITGRLKDKSDIEKANKTTFERFTISMTDQTLSRQTLFDKTTEMPRVPADRTAYKYRYAYAVDNTFPTSNNDARALYKVDTINKSGTSWAEAGCFPGEPIFVTNPNGQGEDDGVVLSLILDYANHHSFLLVLDAKNMTELARAAVPNPVPVGLHGLWKP